MQTQNIRGIIQQVRSAEFIPAKMQRKNKTLLRILEKFKKIVTKNNLRKSIESGKIEKLVWKITILI